MEFLNWSSLDLHSYRYLEVSEENSEASYRGTMFHRRKAMGEVKRHSKL